MLKSEHIWPLKSGSIPAVPGYNSRIAGVRGYAMVTRHLALLSLLLSVVVSASAAIRGGTVRITVLDSETRSLPTADNDVPRDCDPANYSAYCHSAKAAEIINTLLVQIGNGPPFRITCTIETKWSRCTPLPKGETFEARREKRGILVYYEDDHGKPRCQLYTYVAEEKGAPAQSAPAAAAENQASTETPPAPLVSPEPAAPAAPGSVPAPVMCSFTSTPAGAEITLDGRFVGSTPSVLRLNPGQHDVVVTIAGFADWKRHLTVSPGSEVTVNAVLKKSP